MDEILHLTDLNAVVIDGDHHSIIDYAFQFPMTFVLLENASATKVFFFKTLHFCAN